jgi:hypothetical protein
MAFTMASLLMHDEQTPAGARALLRAASESTPARRAELLESAASVLRELGLECRDARQLVDLDAADCAPGPCL